MAEAHGRRTARRGGPVRAAGKKKPPGRTDPADSRKGRRAGAVGASSCAGTAASGLATTRDEDLALVSATR